MTYSERTPARWNTVGGSTPVRGRCGFNYAGATPQEVILTAYYMSLTEQQSESDVIAENRDEIESIAESDLPAARVATALLEVCEE